MLDTVVKSLQELREYRLSKQLRTDIPFAKQEQATYIAQVDSVITLVKEQGDIFEKGDVGKIKDVIITIRHKQHEAMNAWRKATNDTLENAQAQATEEALYQAILDILCSVVTAVGHTQGAHDFEYPGLRAYSGLQGSETLTCRLKRFIAWLEESPLETIQAAYWGMSSEDPAEWNDCESFNSCALEEQLFEDAIYEKEEK